MSGNLPLLYYLGIFLFVLALAGCIVYWNRRSRVKLPKLFYMRQEHLATVIPALRKIVTKTVDPIVVDFSRVEEMTEGSYMVFLAQVEKALMLEKSVHLYGRRPKSKMVLDILSSQKNYKHQNIQVNFATTPDKANAYNLVDPDYIDEVVNELKKLGFTDYYAPFYDYLIELIGNATEHGLKQRNINWWLLKYRDYSARCMRYVFVDMGEGIVQSYKRRGMLWKYLFRNRKRIPLDALYGKLGSSTGEPNRGRGLPQICDIIEKGYISDFILITNSVSLRYINREFIVSRNPNFVGTYYSWTISKENFVTWKSTQ